MRKKPEQSPAPMPQIADRLPPHSLEAEQGVLGCVMLQPVECIEQCLAKFEDPSGVFYDLRHQHLFDCMREMHESNEFIDPITVQQRLRDRNQLEALGGMPYIAGLMNCVPSAANLDYYLDIVIQKATLRRLIQTGTRVVAQAYEADGTEASVDQLVDEAERDILTARGLKGKDEAEGIGFHVDAAITLMETMHASKGGLLGLSTGLVDLDEMTSGLKSNDYIIIAGRPSCGKSSIGMQIVDHVAIDLKQPVGVFSLEMSAASLVLRMICTRSYVNLRKIVKGETGEREQHALIGAAGKIRSAPIHIDDSSGLSISKLKSKARAMKKKHDIKLIVVDYLQMLTSTSKKATDRRLEVADISKGLKQLTKDLGVPVIALSQLSRSMEKENRRPRLSDLREAGEIEQDADIVGMLWRPDEKAKKGEEEEELPLEYPVNLFIAKQRNGPTGDVHLFFRRSITRFEPVEKNMGEP